MTISFEISDDYRDKWPPFTDGCPKCVFPGTVVPVVTVVHGDQLTAYYIHGRCGHEWTTTWGAQWDHTWVRVGPEQPQTLPPYNPPALPAA